jgi:RHS repeat-associated protein
MFKGSFGTALRYPLALAVALACVSTSVRAQAPLPPLDYQLDANGVDLVTGQFHFSKPPDVSIGPAGPQGLTYSTMSTREHVSNWITAWNSDGVGILISMGFKSDYLDAGGRSTRGTGAFMDFAPPLGDPNRGAYTTRDGVRYRWGVLLMSAFYWRADIARVGSIAYPTGEIATLHHDTGTRCDSFGTCRPISRLARVSNNTGYGLIIQYASNNVANSGWEVIQRVTAVNTTVCALSDPCALSGAWPHADYLTSTTECPSVCRTVIDAAGQRWLFRYGGTALIGVRTPGHTTDNITVAYHPSGRVSSVTNARGTTTYSDSNPLVVTDAANHQTIVTWNEATKTITSIRDPLNRTTQYMHDEEFRLKRVTEPEGNYTEWTYDFWSNITQTTHVSKDGASSIVTTASFTCAQPNIALCSKPTWTQDAKGNRTDYTYHTSGLLESVTLPAPSSGAARPSTRYTIEARTARYLTAPGTFVNSEPIYRVTGVSSCATGASCSGTADELKSAITYGTPGAPNNLLPTVRTSGAGDGSLSSTVVTTYDQLGNARTVDGPLSGAADTTHLRYDGMGRLIGRIGVDPDGTGPHKHPALRYTYDSRGYLTQVDTGTMNGPSDADWSAFAVLESVTTEYDGFGRKNKTSFAAGGAVHAVRQFSYDAAGRIDCVAARMNPAAFGALPASACTLAPAGTFGPDRITKWSYDDAGQVIQVTSAFGTADAAGQSTTYTDNGRVRTVTDANGNRTTYELDGFDRPLKTRYPDKDTAGASSASDFEEILSYDANSNPLVVRIRNGSTTTFTYDNLNRLQVEDVPEDATQDVFYSYDNFNRMRAARFGSTSGSGILITPDAAGHSVVTQSFGRSVTRSYDPALNRLRLTHPDLYYVDYQYNVAGQLSSITDSTGKTLAAYEYDDAGRRIGFGRDIAGAAGTGYGYDPIGRLQALTHDLAGAGYDDETTFTYSPSAQMRARTQANSDRYGWSPNSSSTVSASVNGLNQLETFGEASIGYGSNGNLTSDGIWVYSYDSQDRLIQATGSNSATLRYDPLGLLRRVTPSSGTDTEFLYDGLALIAEFNASTGALLRRYVHGPGADEPITWYEGASVGDANRRYLYSDERGSIVAVSDNAGTGTASYTYSPTGEVSASSGSRFKYTGQIAIPEIGLYYYKARMYSPRLGRFLQSDPIGYTGGMNLYAYAGGDPINSTDPLGLDPVPFPLPKIGVSGTELTPPCYWCEYTILQRDYSYWGVQEEPLDQVVVTVKRIGPEQQGGTCPAPASNANTIALPMPGTRGSESVKWGALGRALGTLGLMLSLSGSTPQANIPIYRAVGSAELAQIQSTQQYAPAPSGFGEKQFWLNLSSAQTYGNMAIARGWDPALTIVQSFVGRPTFSAGMPMQLDGMPAISFPIIALPAVNSDAARSGGIRVVQTCTGTAQ